jgi:hypothetical protein
MLQLVEDPDMRNVEQCTFDEPFELQKFGLQMLITLNRTSRKYLTAPDVGEPLNIVVIKQVPTFLFNPEEDDEYIKYNDYLGNVRLTTKTEILLSAINSLKED